MDATTRKVLIRDNAPALAAGAVFFLGFLVDAVGPYDWAFLLGVILSSLANWYCSSRLDRRWSVDQYTQARVSSPRMVNIRTAARAAWILIFLIIASLLLTLEHHTDGEGTWAQCWSWPWFFLIAGLGCVYVAVSWTYGMIQMRIQRRANRGHPMTTGNNPRHSAV